MSKRSRRELRLEQALAAFALGDDAEAARIAADDAAVMGAVGCLLDAARAAPPAGLPASSPGPLRSLHAAASAVSAAARGEHALARRWLGRVAPDQREALLVKELGAAIDLSARRSSEEANDTSASRISLPLLRRLGPAVFEDPGCGAACIYEGFAWIEEDPQRASRAFDRAIARGGDLVEALRGKLLVALSGADVFCDEGGALRWSAEAAGLAAAVAAERLARALRRTPDAAPIASVAAMVAAEERASIGDTRAARAAIAAARKSAPEAMVPAIDLLEARALAPADPARAAALLDALLARDPAHREAWRLRVALEVRRGDRERAEALIVRAADATRDPDLIRHARGVRIARGEIAPFDGFVPGVTTAGELAAEIRRVAAAGLAGEDRASRARPSAPLAPIAQRCRGALAPSERLAFDAARIVIAEQCSGGQAARARFVEVASERRSSPGEVSKLAAIMLLLDEGAALVGWATSLAGSDDAGPALMGLIEAAVAAVEIPIAKKILTLAGDRLTRKEVFRAKSLIARVDRGGFAGSVFALRPEAVARELDALLAPHFCVSDDEDEDLDDDDPFDGVSLPPSVLAAFFETLELPVRALEGLPAGRRAALEAEARAMMSGRPGPAASSKLRALVMRVVDEIGSQLAGSEERAGRAGIGGKR